MIKPEYLICARTVSIDQQSNSLSIFEVLEGLVPAGFPALFPEFRIIARIRREGDGVPNENVAKLVITLGTHKLLDDNVEFTFHGAATTRIIVALGGLLVPAPGVLRVMLEVADGSATYGMQIDAPEEGSVPNLFQSVTTAAGVGGTHVLDARATLKMSPAVRHGGRLHGFQHWHGAFR